MYWPQNIAKNIQHLTNNWSHKVILESGLRHKKNSCFWAYMGTFSVSKLHSILLDRSIKCFTYNGSNLHHLVYNCMALSTPLHLHTVFINCRDYPSASLSLRMCCQCLWVYSLQFCAPYFYACWHNVGSYLGDFPVFTIILKDCTVIYFKSVFICFKFAITVIGKSRLSNVVIPHHWFKQSLCLRLDKAAYITLPL